MPMNNSDLRLDIKSSVRTAVWPFCFYGVGSESRQRHKKCYKMHLGYLLNTSKGRTSDTSCRRRCMNVSNILLEHIFRSHLVGQWDSCSEFVSVRAVIVYHQRSMGQWTPSVWPTPILTCMCLYLDFDYPVIELDGARWRRFWWYTANSAWPEPATDVLQGESLKDLLWKPL